MRGRATTPALKRAAIERLYAHWLARPQLRLGQLVCVLAAERTNGAALDPFNIEDEPLTAHRGGDGE